MMTPRSLALRAGALCLASLASPHALAGGTPEHALLVIDPLSPDSLYVGNVYWNARSLLENGVLFLDPDAPNYPSWTQTVQVGFFGEMAQRGTRSRIDYAIVTPGNSFFVAAPGLLTDSCFPVNRFALASCFTAANHSDLWLAGGQQSTSSNGFASLLATPTFFDSETLYRFGSPSGGPAARSYFIGAMLGYSGNRGNTVEEIIQMIDRSVAADGSFPSGTFYLMNNTADAARNVRAARYTPVTTNISSVGGTVEQINGQLPLGRQDALGIVTGFASSDVAGGDFTLVPGGFADHLTSFAATFDNGTQTKMSEWIRKGASGTSGAVEEPCNFTAKFPDPNLHNVYLRGMSLGEAWLRSMSGTPFQTLFIGDPLTRAYTHIPLVSVPDAPSGPVSGSVTLTPVTQATAPGAFILFHELLIDGELKGTFTPTAPMEIDTTTLDEGWHDVRVLAYDSTATRSVGRWVGSIEVANHGRSAAIAVAPETGALTNFFDVTTTAAGAEVDEVRVLHLGRVVATSAGPGTIRLRGRQLGAGPVTLRAETVFKDGTVARSEPVTITIDPTTPSTPTATPVAYGYTRTVDPSSPFVLELPAVYRDQLTSATYTIVTPPALGTFTQSGAALIVTPSSGSCGLDQIVFNVSTPSGTSNDAIITIVYPRATPCIADVNLDCAVDVLDLLDYLDAFGSCQGSPAPCGTQGFDADLNGDATIDILDLLDFLNVFSAGCD